MSEHAHGEASAGDHGGHGHGHDAKAHEQHYIKIWGILLVLLVISILGPTLEIWWLTLVTAFGIAFVKAGLVAKEFMHVNVEKPFVWYSLVTALVFMLLFFFGTAPDVMNHDGTRWENVAAKAEIDRALEAAANDPHGHGGDHGEAHGDTHGSEGAHGDAHGGEHGKAQGDAQHGDAHHTPAPAEHGKEEAGGSEGGAHH